MKYVLSSTLVSWPRTVSPFSAPLSRSKLTLLDTSFGLLIVALTVTVDVRPTGIMSGIAVAPVKVGLFEAPIDPSSVETIEEELGVNEFKLPADPPDIAGDATPSGSD